MNTNELINVLSADAQRSPLLGRSWTITLCLGFLAAFLLMTVTIELRPDLLQVILTWRFLAKLALGLSLALVSLVMARQVSRPEAGSVSFWLGAIPLVVMCQASLAEVILVPASEWWPRMVGSNALFCLSYIPILSLPPLAITLVTMRHGATTKPALAGAVAGLLSGALGATAYALHCDDDSPFFVALWYSIGIACVSGLGSLIARRMLRW